MQKDYRTPGEKYKAALHRRAMRYGKTARGALAWLDRLYTGNTRTAFRHQMDCPPYKLTAELQLRYVYKSIVRREKEFSKSA